MPLIERLQQHRPSVATRSGWLAFQLGLFLLASSLLLAVIPLFWALLEGTRHHRPRWWRDRVNLWLVAVAVLMTCAAPFARSGWLAWPGLVNWLPFFWGFWGFQPYLMTPAARRRITQVLVAGTVPVVVTGLGQLLLGWSGPWEVLNRLVIWHMDPGGLPPGRLSGLFDYANVAAAWLAFSWPLLLAVAVSIGRQWWGRWSWKQPTVLLLVVSQLAALYLTDSRNAWGAAVVAVPLVLGPARWIWLLPVLLLLLLPVLLAVLPGIPELLQLPARAIVPEAIWSRLSDLAFSERPLASTRLGQWSVAVSLVADRPWLGWGAAAFSLVYPERAGVWHGHPHNLPLELAISFGLPAALMIVGLVVWLLVRSLQRGMFGADPFERGWWTAFVILALLHATDLPLYSGQINVVGWILLAGLRTAAWPRPSGLRPDV